MRCPTATSWTCSRCLLAVSGRQLATGRQNLSVVREYHHAIALRSDETATLQRNEHEAKQDELGAMSRRLSGMAEETMDTGSKSDRKMMRDAGFSEDLKKELEERIAQTTFREHNRQAVTEAELPTYAGKGTQEQAAAQVWTGAETLHDSALRMLDDSHKKLRTPLRASRLPPRNLRPTPKQHISPADRLARARDKTSIYAISQQENMSEKEKEQYRKELKDRFTPGARPMPTSLQGLTSLANERIEDAIAQGQFRNIKRGKNVNTERDYNANSPFLDTTEYFMNKIIQKQEIVPPWIEKQQELVKTVASFRGRMRNDWKRHAARSIASRGGTLRDQIRRAEAYALAEERLNPDTVKVERLSEIDSQGNLNTVTLEERIVAGVVADQMTDEANVSATMITVTETSAEDAPKVQPQGTAPAQAPPSVQPMAYPFRDTNWENTERAYHTLAISEINSLTRSYNLMAPKLAQKPYYTLERELKRCFTEVAPQVAAEIEQRATARPVKIEVVGHWPGGVMEQFAGGHAARVRDEDYKSKGYGFKQFWRDLFRKEEAMKNV